MIYVLQVCSGKEIEAADALEKLGYTVLVPKVMRTYRLKGVWKRIAEVLFDSYLFLSVDALTGDDYYKIKPFGRFLSRSTSLSATEENYINLLTNNNETIGISSGHLENGVLKIDNGFLRRFENKIVKYSKRQHRATVETTLYGKPYRLVCSINID